MPTRTLVLALLGIGCHGAPPQAPAVHHQPDDHGVTIAPDGVTVLAGNGVDCTRDRAAGWSLSVAGGAGRGETVELMWCGSGVGADLAEAVQRTLGEPSSGACWSVCSWISPEASLVHHSTRTVTYDVLTLVTRRPRDR